MLFLGNTGNGHTDWYGLHDRFLINQDNIDKIFANETLTVLFGENFEVFVEMSVMR